MTDRRGDRDVQVFEPDGDFIRRIGPNTGPPYNEPLEPVGVAAGLADDVYVTSNRDYVFRFGSNGVLISRWGGGPFGDRGPGNLDDPTGIATDAAGNVYVTQEGGDRVEKFTSDGVFIDSWGGSGAGNGQFAYPDGVAYAPSGGLFVADTWNHRIQEFTTGGVFTSKFGSRGDTPTQFRFPSALATDCRSRLYVSDTGNHRVLVFGDPATGPPPCTTSSSGRMPVAGPPALVIGSAAGGFRATLSTSKLRRGAMRQSGAVLRERGGYATGRFGGRLSRGRRGLPTLAPFTGGGTWKARFDVTANLATRGGSASGYTLATARRRRGVRVCLRFTTRFSVVGNRVSVTGRFRSRGGTRAGARLVANGRFTQRYSADGSSTMTGRGRARQGRKRGLTAPCRRLARAR